MKAFLSGCQKIENLAGKIYQRLSRDEEYDPRVRSLFQTLSGDERTHAGEIDMLLHNLAHNLDINPRFSWEVLETALLLAERMAKGLESKRLSEEEALRLAVQMEQQFVKVHVNNALHFYDPRVAAVFEELGRHDQIHLQKLRDCLHWWHARRKTPE